MLRRKNGKDFKWRMFVWFCAIFAIPCSILDIQFHLLALRPVRCSFNEGGSINEGRVRRVVFCILKPPALCWAFFFVIPAKAGIQNVFVHLNLGNLILFPPLGVLWRISDLDIRIYFNLCPPPYGQSLYLMQKPEKG